MIMNNDSSPIRSAAGICLLYLHGTSLLAYKKRYFAVDPNAYQDAMLG